MKQIAMTSAATVAMVAAFANKGAAAPQTPADAPAATGGSTRTAPELTGVLSLALPERKRTSRGSATIYPFDQLTEVGQFFGVKNKDFRGMTSVVSNQNKKYKTELRDTAGAIQYETKKLTDASGAVTEVPDASKPKMTFTRKFEARNVDATIADMLKGTDAEGSKVLIVRVK